ncbi:GNAT family N-acetyltransferase [Parafrigoribacterium mesophilum]|uniref:GNAT family N-acetyltransferase n=1 Tax=Parafrigoribacterium mesophilum TaxID=433646 RepID=UPI0031FCC84B
MSSDYRTHPVPAAPANRLAGTGLRLGLVNTKDSAAFSAWLEAVSRGFHDRHPSQDALAAQLLTRADRRTTGVWDDSGADPGTPIGTSASRTTQLTVPGHTSVTGWAISAVSVAPTHRRRGIARAMMEAELSTADALGVPIAILTVSEATIYDRYGFAPAVFAADWTIDTRRARWIGPQAPGRVHFVTLEQLRHEGLALVERVRQDTPGQIEFSGHLWERLLGLHGDSKEPDRALRFVRYDDEAGHPEGFGVYRVVESPAGMPAHVVELQYLVAASADAYAGLWRFLLELDLVAEVRAPLRSVDEPFVWQVVDARAARKTSQRDHLWTRILDVKGALEARRYGAPGRILFDVQDSFGFAAGGWLLDIAADGSASVTRLADEATDAAATDAAGQLSASVSLRVNELSALYLGGVSAVTLTRAGRITELIPGSAAALDACFRATVVPWLSIWF